MENPYGSPDDEEVVGYLGGEEAEGEELPALPGVEDSSYSARDFMDSDPEQYADPYADPYAQDEFQDPYALPPQTPTDDQYEGYDAEAMAKSDPSYFDSLGHQEDEVATRPMGDYSDAGYEDDETPKTISQQDAESIIRRITTKRILPPESTSPTTVARPSLTSGGGGLRIWPILLVILILGGAGIFMFREEIAKRYPALAQYLGVEIKEEIKQEVRKVDPPEVVLKRAMLGKVLKSELKAFGAQKSDLKPKKKSKREGRQR